VIANTKEIIGYRHLFEHTRTALEKRGIAVALKFGPRVLPTDFKPLEQAWGLLIPPPLRQFYLETGNGLTFHWSVDPDATSQPFCRLNVPTLAELSAGIDYLRMLSGCLAGHDFWEVRDTDEARRQYQRQLTYFPFLAENADLLCIDPASREAIVFHDHEWSFYTAGDSGVFLAGSLAQFWQGWSEVGFVEPNELWWPRTADIGGTIWSQENFGFYLGPPNKALKNNPPNHSHQ
jgi:hypothetical protein